MRFDWLSRWNAVLRVLCAFAGFLRSAPSRVRWNVVVRVLYALAAFLGSAASLVTALNGWGHI